MYVTRPFSLYLNDQEAMYFPPPEGPNSGILVISDAEAETQLGWRRDNNDGAFFRPYRKRIRKLPFPQNRDLTVSGSDDTDPRLIFIPVLNHPLSANRYYVISRDSCHKGEAITSSKEEDKVRCCWGDCIEDVPPCPLHPSNLYQQFEITLKPRDRFEAKSVAPDGLPPLFLRDEWKLYHMYHHNNPRHDDLNEALGLDSSLRALLPDFNFSSSNDRSEPVVVGKWYCPFMFLKQYGKKSKNMMKKSMFYEMTLEQRWVRVYSKENNDSGEKGVHMDVVVQPETAKIAGTRNAFWDEKAVGSGVLWFSSDDGGKTEKIGLSMAIVERMKWEQERGGYVGGTGNERMVRVEKFEGNGMWRKFGCYLLVETFVLKRKDGILVLTYDYNHTHQVRCKWE